MGFLHEGHLRLLDAARAQADVVVLSIFVNPLQFGPGEDFARYPRDEAGDLEKAAARGVELVFAPALNTMYPATLATVVTPVAAHDRWEGAIRPGHFQGVLTVVAKLFHIVTPDLAAFGQKDIQQATLIRAMVRDLDFPIEIVVTPTVREADGLAMSSRNAYLSAPARARARVLSRALFAMREAWTTGTHGAAELEAIGREMLATEPAVVTDYLAIVHPEQLESVAHAPAGTIVLVAARVDGTRLIDNVILGG
jgi:pantoate--beta-alanine ligase